MIDVSNKQTFSRLDARNRKKNVLDAKAIKNRDLLLKSFCGFELFNKGELFSRTEEKLLFRRKVPLNKCVFTV